MLDSKDKQIITIDGNVLIASDIPEGVNQLIATEALQTEHAHIVNDDDENNIEDIDSEDEDISDVDFEVLIYFTCTLVESKNEKENNYGAAPQSN